MVEGKKINEENVFEGYLKDLPEIPTCPLCEHPELAKRYQKNYALGKVTKREFEKFFNCDFITIAEHMMYHDEIVKPLDKNKDKWVINTEGDFYINNLLSSLQELDELKDLMLTGGSHDANTIKAIVTVMKEIRDTLKDVAISKGQLTSGNEQKITINIDKINNNYLALTQVIMEECCPECQKKVLQVIENNE